MCLGPNVDELRVNSWNSAISSVLSLPADPRIAVVAGASSAASGFGGSPTLFNDFLLARLVPDMVEYSALLADAAATVPAVVADLLTHAAASDAALGSTGVAGITMTP